MSSNRSWALPCLLAALALASRAQVGGSINNPGGGTGTGFPITLGTSSISGSGSYPYLNNLQIDAPIFNGSTAPVGINNGDSVFAGAGNTGTSATWAGHIILTGLGVPQASITDLATNGTGVLWMAQEEINHVTVTNSTITTNDGLHNNATIGSSELNWQTAKQALLGMYLDGATADPSVDQSGQPSKQFATSATTTGTVGASTNFPSKGETCTSGPCTFTWNNVPGRDIFVLVEADYNTGGYNPSVTVDGQAYTGSWSSGAWVQGGFQETTVPIAFSPWPMHITLPDSVIVSNNTQWGYGAGHHTVVLTMPSSTTAIEVIGLSGDRTIAGPMFVQSGEFLWANSNDYAQVAANNAAMQAAAIEAEQAGANVIFTQPDAYIDGYAAPLITFSGNVSSPPNVTINITGGVWQSVTVVSGGSCSGSTGTGTVSGYNTTPATVTVQCGGGVVTGVTVTAGGAGYSSQQVFNTQAVHPNNYGSQQIANANLAHISSVVNARNADAMQGTAMPWMEHDGINANISPIIMPYMALTSLELTNGMTAAVIDPGRPGQHTKLQICTPQNAGGADTFTFPSTVTYLGVVSNTDKPPIGTCDLFLLSNMTISGDATTSFLWYATLIGSTNIQPTLNAYVPAWAQYLGNASGGAENCSGNLSGDRYYSTFTVTSGNTCTVNSNVGLVVHATGKCQIAGTINARGVDNTSSNGYCAGSGGGSGGGTAGGTQGQSIFAAVGGVGLQIAGGGGAGAASGGNGSNGNATSNVAYTSVCIDTGGGTEGAYFGGGAGKAGGSSGGAAGIGGAAVVLICQSITGTDGVNTGTINAYGGDGQPAAANTQGAGSGGGGGTIILSSQATIPTLPNLSVAPGAGGLVTVPEVVGDGGTCTTPPTATLAVSGGALSTATIVSAGAGCGTGTGITWNVYGGGGTVGTASFSPTWSGGTLTALGVTAGTSSGYTAATYTTAGTGGNGFAGITQTWQTW
jgi:hypothetical protein